jgi:hypothetical protein
LPWPLKLALNIFELCGHSSIQEHQFWTGALKAEDSMKSELNKSHGLNLWAESMEVGPGKSRGRLLKECAISAAWLAIATVAEITIICGLIFNVYAPARNNSATTDYKTMWQL